MQKYFVSKLIVPVALLLIVVGCGQAVDSSSEKTVASNETAAAPSESNFYDGEVIEIIVPASAGGGTDTTGRFLAPFLSEHINGQPAVQVVNIPGGGTIVGSNEFYRLREPNGLSTLLISGSTTAPYLLGEPAVQYDFSKMTPILGIPDGGVVYASAMLDIQEPKDILNTKESIVYGGLSATGLDLVTLLSFEILGLELTSVLGYEGRGAVRVALEQNETNIDYQTTSAYTANVIPLVEEGIATPLYSLGHLDINGEVIRDPSFPEIPSFKEFYVEVYGEEPSGAAWEAYKLLVGALYSVQKVLWVHDNIPADALNDLRKGAEQMVQDSEFTQQNEDINGYNVFVGEELEQLVKVQQNLDEDIINWLLQFLDEKYDVRF